MIDMDANPYVQNYKGRSENEIWSGMSNLSNLPKSKSVYFQLRNFNSDMPSPWEYKAGVYNQGKFGRVRGSGGEGTVIEGKWQNQKAAFKFVEVRDQKFIQETEDALADMNARLNEMMAMESTKGSAILNFDGHYR